MKKNVLNPVASVITEKMTVYAEKPAVKAEGKEFTFKTVDQMADDILNRLFFCLEHTSSYRPNTLPHSLRIGVCLPRDRYLIPAVWAILKMGYTYVPLDPETPVERLRFILQDCDVSVVLCENCNSRIFGDIPTVNVLYADTPEKKLRAEWINPSPDIAYIIYTSGTTGKPKGVPISYLSLLNFISSVSAPDYFNISHKTRILCFASINFDASILDIIAPLYYGGTIVLANETQRRDILQLSALMKGENVTTALLPPSLITLMPDYDFPDLDTLIIAGEKMLPDIIRKASPFHYRLVNAYGPTENTVISTVREIVPGISCENIGKLVSGVTGHILRPDLTPVEIGETGELHLGGLQLTSGYLNRPEQNRERFIPNPFADKEEAPVLYKTGDLVRLMPDGSYDFIGRKDTQVKFNGYRIELEEIAREIEQCDGVVQACVSVESKKKGDSLVAYVKLSGDTETGTINEAKKRLKDYLPYYMQPSSWVEVKEFPRNINGKIDRKQQENLHCKPVQTARKPDKNKEEEIMAHVVAYILEQETVDIDSDLFDDLGMTSIQVMQVPIELEISGIYISVDDIYRNRTVRRILQNHAIRLSYWFNEPVAAKPVLVIVSGYTSFAFLYAEMAQALSDRYSIYVLESYHEYPDEVACSCAKLIQHYMDALLPIAQEQGIAVITGFCLGGELGLLLAHELSRKTTLLPHVIVLDGEVERSKLREENIPLYLDIFSEEVNRRRSDRDIALIETMPDFRYSGKVTSILASRFMADLSPFSDKIVPTERQITCARHFYERTPGMWKRYYPDCHLFYVEGDHWTYLHTPETTKPIIHYLRSLTDNSTSAYDEK